MKSNQNVDELFCTLTLNFYIYSCCARRLNAPKFVFQKTADNFQTKISHVDETRLGHNLDFEKSIKVG